MKTELRYGNAQQGNQLFNISPTLIIGLGGSGKEVLMRLRRLFYMDTKTTGLPIIEYLWIDTDPRRQDISGKDYDAISKKLYFESPEIIDAEVQPDEINHYFNRKNRYQHIFEWLHPSISDLGDNMLKSGAGQVRPCGRLAFFHHYNTISQVINQKINRISNANAYKETLSKGYIVDNNRLDAYIVSSIGGGTGAGMLIDCAFLLKNLQANINNIGMLFLPTVFDNIPGINDTFRSKIHANGYAALMELDYFMAPNVGTNIVNANFPRFTFKWDGQEHEIAAPPFLNAYMIDAKNSSNKALQNNTELFQMVAEAMYLEFSKSKFGDNKRSIRSNLTQFLNDETRFYDTDAEGNEIYSQYFPNRYFSFGLSSIKLDIARKKNAAAYFLAQSILGLWDSGKPAKNGVSTEVKQAFRKYDGEVWNYKSMREHFTKDDDKQQCLDNFYKNKIQQDFELIGKRIQDQFRHNTVKEMFDFYETRLKDTFNEIIEDVENDIWHKQINNINTSLGPNGSHANQINKNAESCFDDMKISFFTEFNKFIALPGELENKKGREQAAQFLKESVAKLKSIKGEDFDSRKYDSEKENSFKDHEKPGKDENISKQLQFLVEARQIKAPLYCKTSVGYHQNAVDAKLKQYISDVENKLQNIIDLMKDALLEWCEIRYHNVVCEKAWTILDNLCEELSVEVKIGHGADEKTEWRGLSGTLDQYHQGLIRCKKRCKDLFDAYNTEEKQIRNHDIVMDSGEAWYLEKIHRTLRTTYADGNALSWEDILDRETDKYFEDIVNAIPNNMLPEDGIINRKWGFKYLFQELSKLDTYRENKITDHLDYFCKNRLDGFLSDIDADTEFQRDLKYEQILKHITSLSDYYIPSSKWINTIQNDLPSKRIIGIPDLNNFQTFDTAQRITQYAGCDVFKHNPGNLIFYSELAAFPMVGIGGLENSRKFYLEILKNKNFLYHRHLDYTIIDDLRDILPPENETKSLDRYKTGLDLIEALMLGILDYDKEKGTLNFLPPLGDVRLDNIILGKSFHRAVQILSMNNKYHNILTDQIEKRKATIKSQGRDLNFEILILINHYQNNVYLPLQRGGYGLVTNEKSNTQILLDGLREQYRQDSISQTGKQIDWEKIQQQTDTIDEISDVFPFKEKEAKADLRMLKV
ncbi:MAG: tubulin-like doman-containing protein [Pseudomonadota bacterium]